MGLIRKRFFSAKGVEDMGQRVMPSVNSVNFGVDSRGPNSCWLYGQQEITPACDVPVLVSVVTNGTP